MYSRVFKPFAPYNIKGYAECGTKELFWRAQKCREGLASVCSVLPRVDENGHSECPFAETLYEKADAWLEESQEQRRQLGNHRDEAHAAMEESQRKKRDATYCDDDFPEGGSAEMHESDYREHREWHNRIKADIRALDEAIERARATIAERRKG